MINLLKYSMIIYSMCFLIFFKIFANENVNIERKKNYLHQTIQCSIASNQNKNFKVLHSLNLEFKDKFVKAASGVKFIETVDFQKDKDVAPNTFYILQDSSRFLGSVKLSHKLIDIYNDFKLSSISKIDFIPIDLQENIKKYENLKLDYEKIRKKNKIDVESTAILPSGNLLILGSGSDILKANDVKQSFRSNAIVVDLKTKNKSTYKIYDFYKNIQNNRDIIGQDIDKEKAQLNIEGVSIWPNGKRNKISFFHRGNLNGHNSIIEYDFDAWQNYYLTSKKLPNSLKPKPLKIININFGTIKNKFNDKTVPITLNDALYGEKNAKPIWFIPVSTEADYIDSNGNQHDGIVTFSGIALIENMIDPSGGICTIFQTPGDKLAGEESIFGKIEGIAAFSPTMDSPYKRSIWSEKAFVVGVNDIDNENAPSKFSFFNFDSMFP